MVDLKRGSSDNQVNNRGQERPPLRIPYHPPLNQPPPNPGETINSDEIYYIFKSLNYMPQTMHDDTRQEATETMPPTEEQDPCINTVNCFSELSMVEEEEDTKVVFDMHHSYTTTK